jgi:Na+/H+ antiporter NhaC
MSASGDYFQRFRRSMWAMIAFLLGFLLFISILVRWYLIPAMIAASDATPGERRELSAYSMLLLAVVLLIVFAGIVLTFRVSRYFFPRTPPHHSAKTPYIDAWAESARRMRDRPDKPDED